MRNDEELSTAAEPREADARALEPDPSPAPPPLLILGSDDDLVCLDDVCVPASARP
jgi:hypothetical protein